jgi:hypothetical protein
VGGNGDASNVAEQGEYDERQDNKSTGKVVERCEKVN